MHPWAEDKRSSVHGTQTFTDSHYYGFFFLSFLRDIIELMKIILKDNNTYVLSCSRDEEIMSEIKKFAEKNNIEAASFSIIGAAKEVELAWYDVDIKEYTTKTFTEKLEIVSMTGNVGVMDKDTIVHSHGVFSNKEMQTMGGHINKVVVAAACEITLEKLEGAIKREYSKEIGLNLMEE